VTRLTVYNHFGDLSELLPACSAHYMALHPPPDFASIDSGDDPVERVRLTLQRLYGWYREVEPMFGKLFSDRAAVPELDRFMAGEIDMMQAGLADELASPFPARGKRAQRLRSLIRLALDFWTWNRLGRDGLDDRAAAELMAGAVADQTKSSA
jgi:AcrR family transcriptional regulator